jgi:hypothetical protein
MLNQSSEVRRQLTHDGIEFPTWNIQDGNFRQLKKRRGHVRLLDRKISPDLSRCTFLGHRRCRDIENNLLLETEIMGIVTEFQA